MVLLNLKMFQSRFVALTGIFMILGDFCAGDKSLFITESYFFPYMCSVVFGIEEHHTADWVSTCTIVNKRWVAVSVENMNQPRPLFFWPYYYHVTDGLRVHAGSVFGIPEKLDQNLLKKLRHHQAKKVKTLWVPLDASFVYDTNKTPRLEHYSALLIQDRNNAPNMTKDITWNLIGGAEWGVGFLQLDPSDPFEWNAQILPAPLSDTDSSRLGNDVRHHVDELENHPFAQTSCSVGAWDHKTEKLLFYQVSHVPFTDCQSLYCTYDPRGCLRFPRYEHHICFKSLVYGDLCPEDRGAALYCSNFKHSILGILTTAPNCGYENLPNVYTLIHHVTKAVDSLQQRFDKIDDLSAYNLLPPRH